MKRYLTEFVGTFFLVLTIGLASTRGIMMPPLAIAYTLMVMVYMGGHVSGGHYNPAVSLAVLLRGGAMKAADFVPYVLSQLAGAVLASVVVHAVTGKSFAPAPGPGEGMIAALVIEILFTFALALVVLNVATSSKTQGNSYYGLAIGSTVGAGAFVGGPISGGAFNPAVGTGPILMNAIYSGGSFEWLWLYWVGPLIGAALAAAMFKIQEKAE
ncbi:MAG TPA: aquaporin [Dongiaceae bacterium]|nr:aquaporin [Dongiaceae bacterium]